MQATEYIWLNGKFVKWNDAKVHVLSHCLHYGVGAFEGIRAYKGGKKSAVFKLNEHIDRLFYSCDSIKISLPYTKEEIRDIILELLRRNNLEEGYIRPLAYYGYGEVGINPKGCKIDFTIACWPWAKYLPHKMVDIKTSSYIRVHPKSTVADAKLCGNYINSCLASMEIRDTHYHEALLLDEKGFIAEGVGENLFLVKNGKMYTPKLGNILAGITRKTVMELAELHSCPVIEKNLVLADAYDADEAFFTGTAVEITPIRSLDDKVISDGEIGKITKLIKDDYYRLVRGDLEDFNNALTFV